MKNGIGFRFFGFLLIVFVLNGCGPKELSPEIKDTMNKYGVTKEQIYKGNNLTPYDTIERKHIKLGLEFKKFESYCNKINGEVKSDQETIVHEYDVFGNPKNTSTINVIYCNNIVVRGNKGISRKGYIYSQEDNNYFYSRIEEIEKKNKVESEKMAQLKDVQSRLRALGITEKDIRDDIDVETILTQEDVDIYLMRKEKRKQKQKEKEEYEKNVKIKVGKQYICTDGYDSWVLKYNGDIVTFGDINFHFLHTNIYQRYNGDNNPIRIDRENSTMIFSGNKLTCRPR